jgi:hypothetical protein
LTPAYASTKLLSGLAGGLVPFAIVQQPQPFEPSSPDDTFHDMVDVIGVAVPLAFAVLLLAVSWPAMKRWVRHRIRRRRRRHHHDAHHDAPAAP